MFPCLLLVSCQALNDALSSMIKKTNSSVLSANELAAALQGNPLSKMVMDSLLEVGTILENSIPKTRNLLLYKKWDIKDPANAYVCF